MINIKDTVKNPARALELMCDGVETQRKRSRFKVRMSSFGGVEWLDKNPYCFCCAATCALQEMAGVNLTHLNIEQGVDRAKALDVYFREMAAFETALDFARRGLMKNLFEFFSLPYNGGELQNRRIQKMETWNYIAALPSMRKYIEKLRLDNPTWA